MCDSVEEEGGRKEGRTAGGSAQPKSITPHNDVGGRSRFVWPAQGIVHLVIAVSTTTTNTLHYPTLHYTTLNSIALRYTTLRYTE